MKTKLSIITCVVFAQVPEDVKSKNTQKVEDLNVEKSQLDDAVEQLAKLQL